MTVTITVAALLPWPDGEGMAAAAFVEIPGQETILVFNRNATTYAALQAVIKVARAYCRVTAAARN